MKGSFFLALISIGFVAGDGAWKENHEYTYKLVDKTFFKEPSSKENGAVVDVYLTIRPQSDNVLIGRITDASFTVLNPGNVSDTDERKSASAFVAVDKQFKIVLKDRLVDTLFVDHTMTTRQINNLKFVVSQFQIDTKAKNVMESENNHLPDANTNNAFYTTNEQTVTGMCETTYDISRLPEYLAYANYDSIPSLYKYAPGEDVIEINKHINVESCSGRSKDMINYSQYSYSQVSIDTRIIITGSLDTYTIHSSVSTNKILGFKNFVYLSLESLKRIDANSNYEYSPRFGRMVDIGNLAYQDQEWTSSTD